jgi:hypothetical protein
MIGLELLDPISEDGQDAAAERVSAGVGADRAHVAEHGVKPLVSHVPKFDLRRR